MGSTSQRARTVTFASSYPSGDRTRAPRRWRRGPSGSDSLLRDPAPALRLLHQTATQAAPTLLRLHGEVVHPSPMTVSCPTITVAAYSPASRTPSTADVVPLSARSKSPVGSFHGRVRPAASHRPMAASRSAAVSSRRSIEVSSILVRATVPERRLVAANEMPVRGGSRSRRRLRSVPRLCARLGAPSTGDRGPGGVAQAQRGSIRSGRRPPRFGCRESRRIP